MRRVLKLIFISMFFCVLVQPVQAQESTDTHKVTYDFNFYMRDKNRLDVELDITLENLRSDIYIKEFSLGFPKTFYDGDLKASFKNKPIPFRVTTTPQLVNVIFNFDEPETRSTIQTLTLKYSHDNLNTQYGGVTEVLMPLIRSENSSIVNATLHLPDNFDDVISISKPKPQSVDFKVISWTNVQAKTIYTLFGKSQTYKTHLQYSLQNPEQTTIEQEIIFPPDTQYQKIFIESITPEPQRTYTDDDGNYIGVYEVPGRTTLDINYIGNTQVFIKPRDENRSYISAQFQKQKDYLLTEQNLWSLGNLMYDPKLKELKSAQEIYSFIVEELSYSHDKLKDNKRVGAEVALREPYNAVCTEYTDTFIALARERGLYAREVQGYGYSNKEGIRPLSFADDTLHAWPEFYVPAQDVWIQTDPTWEDTSGVDYFTGFDVNHVALALHGKDPYKPYPAGFYKTKARKDVDISIADSQESKIVTSITAKVDTPANVTSGVKNSGKIEITNNGNTFMYDVAIIPQGPSISFDSSSFIVDAIAPYETKVIHFTFKAHSTHEKEMMTFMYNGEIVGESSVSISTRSISILQMTLGFFIGLGILATAFLYVSYRRQK